MRALRLLLTAFLAMIAIFAAIMVFFGRLLGRSVRNRQRRRTPEQGRGAAVPADEVIDVETTVVGADQSER